jgi:hypothetical protein
MYAEDRGLQVPMTLDHDPVTSSGKSAPGTDPRIRHRIQVVMFRSIRVDHTNCLRVAIKTHSFVCVCVCVHMYMYVYIIYTYIYISYKYRRTHGHVPETELLKMKKNGQFPDDTVRIKVARIHYVTSQTY